MTPMVVAGGVLAVDPALAAQTDQSTVANAPAKSASAKAAGAAAKAQAPSAPSTPASPAPPQHFDIDDFTVIGADKLPEIDLDTAIYPFLGPNRTPDDVEKARAALEKAYHDKGYQTVSVSVPAQNVGNKVVRLQVAEMKVGRLRVKNSRYFDTDKIKENAPSLKEGGLPEFGAVTKDIMALNQWPDRKVTPVLRAGVAPGTVDVDLNVEDKLPVHGALEYNNRNSPNTTSSRLNATVHYDNLWQLGHSLSLSYQVAPERPSDAQVFSGSYLARAPGVDWLSLLVYGVKSESSVGTVGGVSIIGPGEIVGARAVMTLPTREGFFHTLSAGLDYKHFDQSVKLGADAFSSPVTYYPMVASYGATYQSDGFVTQMNASATSNIGALSSSTADFDAKRYAAQPSFAHFNFDLSHTQELGEGFQLFGKVQAQAADGPLVSSEQFSIGGLDTVRGYLESEVLGDNGVVGNIELRSPDVGGLLQEQLKNAGAEKAEPIMVFNEWRLFGFTDAGRASTLRPLPSQQTEFSVWSYGVGSRFKIFNYFNGVLTFAVPQISQTYTRAGNERVNFRFWGEF
ncbi:hemin-binding protein [Rhodoblastus sphagnicola]|uniref:Hemin-binding protein n=2 Tax=Rhodoblastus sphagnicola TaxID=333368 RepID=A0A2S6NAV5_9HYPH|nr:hemin-binding protein [Rhodoblastus sphagnicola]